MPHHVVLVRGHGVLEEDVGPLPGAADHGVVRVEGEVVQVLLHLLPREQGRDVLVGDCLERGKRVLRKSKCFF